MSYYNQNDYAAIPYPHATRPNATVKSSGCGVCCMSMVVEGLTGQKWGPKDSAAYSISIGARASDGTDMATLSRETAKKFSLEYKITSDINGVVQAVKDGAWAIANVGGDRGNYTGLFSDGGHYVVVAAITGGKFIIWDPNLYAGKFNKSGRVGKVTVKGNDIYCVPEYLDRDCENRSPRYYIFKEEPMKEYTQEDFDKMMENWRARQGEKPESLWSRLEGAWARLRAKGIVDGKAPRAEVTREELAAILDRMGLVKTDNE